MCAFVRMLVAALFFSTCLDAQMFYEANNLLDTTPNSLGLGCSAVDINNDGLIDLYSSGLDDTGNLFIQRPGGTFVDQRSVLSFRDTLSNTPWGITWGAIWGDYNNDGYPDPALIGPNTIHHSVAGIRINPSLAIGVSLVDLSQGAGWADFDNDGRLDLFVNDDTGNNQLLKNVNLLSFNDVSMSAGVAAAGNSYGMSWADYDNDGDQDVFIATCSAIPSQSIKHLLRNNGDGTFDDVNTAAGVNDFLASWGIVWLDYDNDGWLDIYITNSAHLPTQPGYNKLYHNNGDGTFGDASVSAGVRGDMNDFSIGVAAMDFNNDGWVDLYSASKFSGQHRIYLNNQDGTFAELTATAAGIPETTSRVAISGDFNEDGWPDIYIPGSLLLNLGGNNNWLVIETRGVESTYQGIGARVEVYAAGIKQIREIGAGDGFVAQNDRLRAHFGLGSATVVDSVRVLWPGGKRDLLTNVPVNHRLTVVEGLGVDNSPVSFHLISPPDAADLTDSSTAVLSWQAAVDPESRPLEYTLTIAGPAGNEIFTAISDTVFSINLENLNAVDSVFQWSVAASDGRNIRNSYDNFSFHRRPITAINTASNAAPKAFWLEQNYPNPFNPSTTIEFGLPAASSVTVQIYDILGRQVATPYRASLTPGNHKFTWNATDAAGNRLAAGIYIYRVEARGRSLTRKMLLIK